MKPLPSAKSHDGVTLRQAALIAGAAYLLNPVSYAEFSIYPKLVAANNAAQTAQNISSHLGLFAVAILWYIVSFIRDVVIAWALYVPVGALRDWRIFPESWRKADISGVILREPVTSLTGSAQVVIDECG
jgi:hypothetical protein